MDEFMFWLVGWLEGIDGWVLLILIGFLLTLHLVIKAEAPRRDSKRRNQARRIR